MATGLITGNLSQVRVALSGFTGGPGVATYYWGSDVTPNLAALRAFYTALAPAFPPTVTITYPSSGDVIDSATGTLNDIWTATAPATTPGTGSGAVMSASGLQVRWVTDTVADGRSIRGRTFIVPCAANMFGADGLGIAATLNVFTTAANALATATPGHIHVWHRPKFGPRPGAGLPRPIIRPGGSAEIKSGLCLRPAVVLTSRRD